MAIIIKIFGFNEQTLRIFTIFLGVLIVFITIKIAELLFIIPLLFLIQPAFGEIVVQNDQTYVGDDGIMHIVGEIQNNSKSPLNKIKILAVLIDENGNEVNKFEGKMLSNILMPGMKGGFDIITSHLSGS